MDAAPICAHLAPHAWGDVDVAAHLTRGAPSAPIEVVRDAGAVHDLYLADPEELLGATRFVLQ